MDPKHALGIVQLLQAPWQVYMGWFLLTGAGHPSENMNYGWIPLNSYQSLYPYGGFHKWWYPFIAGWFIMGNPSMNEWMTPWGVALHEFLPCTPDSQQVLGSKRATRQTCSRRVQRHQGGPRASHIAVNEGVGLSYPSSFRTSMVRIY